MIITLTCLTVSNYVKTNSQMNENASVNRLQPAHSFLRN